MNYKRILLISYFFLLLTIGHRAMAKLVFENIPKSVISSLKEAHPGLFKDSPTPREADRIVTVLMGTQLFNNIAIHKHDETFKVTGYNIKKIKDIQFTGNKSISDDKLLEAIDFNIGDIFNRKKISSSVNSLVEFYGDSGFFSTQIEVSVLNDSPNYLDIIFIIKEGEPCLIKSLSIESENSPLNEVLSRKTAKYKNSYFSQATIKKIETTMKDHLKEKVFLRSKVEQVRSTYNESRTSAELQYRIIEPYSYELIIKGNNGLSQSEIRREVSLKEFEISTLSPSLEVEQKTKRLYLKKGYPHAKVSSTERSKSDRFSKQILLDIEEGPRVRIESLNVVGRISRPEKYYSDFIFNNSSDILKNKYYNRSDLELGYENLITHLKNNGYLDAKVHSARVDFSKTKDKAKIQIVMDEGPLTQIRSIRFRGLKAYSQEELSKIFKLKTNTPLRLDHLEENINNIRQHYLSNGYLEMKLIGGKEDLIIYNAKRTDATINLKIHEGPQITIGSVVLEGNDFTRDRVILNEIEPIPGEILTQQRVDQILLRLNRLGFFSRVNLRTLEEGTSIPDRTLIISVSEREPGLFRAGVGITSEDNLTIRGFLGVSYNNLRGTGRGLSGRFDTQSNVTESQIFQGRFTLGYLEPFLLETRTRGRVNLTYRLDETEYISSTQTAKMRESSQLDFLLEREFSEQHKLIWTAWSLESERTFEKPASSDSRESKIAAIGPLITLDYRNNPFLPTEGSFTRWETQYSNPLLGSSEGVEFIRTDLRYSFYLPLTTTGIVWANNISGGYLKNLSDLSGGGVPSSRGFTLHGQSKIRGFGGSNRAEHIPNITQFDSLNNVIRGESHYYMLKTEVRWPIPSLEPLAMAIFYDVGAIEFTDSDKQCTSFEVSSRTCVSTNPIRQSLGVGIHLNTPLGPIVLEVARKINPRIGERLDRIHFSIGSF